MVVVVLMALFFLAALTLFFFVPALVVVVVPARIDFDRNLRTLHDALDNSRRCGRLRWRRRITGDQPQGSRNAQKRQADRFLRE